MWRNYKRLLPFAKAFRVTFAISVFFNILTGFASAVAMASLLPAMSILTGDTAQMKGVPMGGMPMPSMGKKNWLNEFTNYFITGDKITSLMKVCIFIFVVYLLKNLFQYIANYVMALVEGGMSKSIRDTVFEKLSTLSLDYFYDRKMGHLIVRVTDDVGMVNSVLSSSMTTLIREPIQILVFLYALISINAELTGVALGIAILSLLLITFIGKRLKQYAHKVQEGIGNFVSIAQEFISGIKVVKSFGMEDYEVKRFRNETKNYFAYSRRLVRIKQTVSPLNEMMAVGGFIGILWFGGQEVFAGNVNGSQLYFFLISLISLMQPVRTLSEVIGRLHEGSAATENIFTVLDAKATVASGTVKAQIEHTTPIEVSHVTFKYQNSTEEVLKDVSIDIKPKEILALVGPSGAGKTTFVDLLARFYDPSSGSISFDRHDLKEYDLQSLRKLFGIVTQDTILFHDTIYNNIAYGNKQASKEDIFEAAKAANAHNFILQFPNGYDTMVGDRGVRLSGGQRQRIAIARALLKNPPILIFDEATSALDTENEMLVQEAIERLLSERTAVVIAHRLSTIQHADRIAVFDKGRIVELGSHEELLANPNGMYYKLYHIQQRAATEGLVLTPEV